CAPGFGALVTNCDLPRSMARGMHVWTHAQRAAYLNVSAGVGTSIYAPVRFACSPEAIVIDLVPRID
ncbi:MAG: metallophosphoesterase, partial [Microbacteriaceae bacterium]